MDSVRRHNPARDVASAAILGVLGGRRRRECHSRHLRLADGGLEVGSASSDGVQGLRGGRTQRQKNGGDDSGCCLSERAAVGGNPTH